MTGWRLGTAVAALMAQAGAGWALTAPEAWEAWKAAAEKAGQTLTAESRRAGFGSLTVQGVGFAVSLDELDMSGLINEVVFTEQPDGSVRIGMSDAYQIDLSADPEIGEKVDGTITVGMPGLDMTASGTSDAVSFAYAVPSLTLSLDELVVEDETVSLEMQATLTDLTGSYAPDAAAATMMSALNAGQVQIAVTAQTPETGGSFAMQVSVADLASQGVANGPMFFFDVTDLPAMLADGYATASSGTIGRTDFKFDFVEGPQSFVLNGGLTGGTSEAGLDGDGLDLGMTLDGLTLTASGSEIPFPQITVAFGQYATKVSLPVTAAETASPFAVGLVLGGVTMGEELWSLIDPAGAIPRDPATAIVELTGMARLLVDLFDDQSVAESESPVALEAVTINRVLLKLAGAEFTGSGAFTFDNSDLTTFDGMPAPDGKVALTLSGGNALLDTLVKIGLLPEQSAMMSRMMAGMMAKPGPAPDTLVSEITVRPDGTLLANGAPLPF